VSFVPEQAQWHTTHIVTWGYVEAFVIAMVGSAILQIVVWVISSRCPWPVHGWCEQLEGGEIGSMR